jgi:hypothetical protein
MVGLSSLKHSLATATRFIVPTGGRAGLRRLHRRFVLARTVREVRREPDWSAATLHRAAHRILYGWGNEGWAADESYAATVMSEALKTRGAVLECGSGATTVLLGLVAERTGSEVWTLEHLPEWADRVRRTLQRLRIRTVRVVSAPLRDRGEYAWYEVDPGILPGAFSLAVCDGPPSSTKGGRFGLVPEMRGRLANGSMILLDDICRASERDVVDRWHALVRFQHERSSTSRPFETLRIEADVDIATK